MADDTRHSSADLSALPAPPEATGFFELLAQLETREQCFAEAGRPEDEPARLGQAIRLAFSTRDVASVDPGMADGGPPRIDVELFGLLGPEGPMPLHLTRWVMGRLSDRWFSDGVERATSDTAFLDFCNLLQHRMIALFWRAWADAHPHVGRRHGRGGRSRAAIAALAGLGLPGGLRDDTALAPALTEAATSMSREVRAPEQLTSILSGLTGAPVTLTEFVGSWTDLPPSLQTVPGRQHAGLGTSAVIGRRVFQRQNRAEIRLGPLNLPDYVALIDDAALRTLLSRAIRTVAGLEITFDLRLVLRGDCVPEPRLGQARLGRTGWLGGGAASSANREDLRLRNVSAPPAAPSRPSPQQKAA